jgi:hypothetical protein
MVPNPSLDAGGEPWARLYLTRLYELTGGSLRKRARPPDVWTAVGGLATLEVRQAAEDWLERNGYIYQESEGCTLLERGKRLVEQR